MKTYKRLISLVLCVVMVSVLALSGCESNAKNPSTAGKIDLVDENNKFAYTVIISSDATAEEREAAEVITDTIKSLYGKVSFKNDGTAVVEGQKELIIGNTKREATQAMQKKLNDNRNNNAADYLIGVENGNIVIVGGSDAALMEAVVYFKDNFLISDKEVFTDDKEIFHTPELKAFTIAGRDISEYNVVIPETDAVYFEEDVNNLIETVRTNCGILLNTVYDSSETLPEYGIYVGASQSKDFMPAASNSCRVVENSGDLHICSKDKTLVALGVKSIENMLLEAKNDKLEIAKDYDSTPEVDLQDDDSYRLVWSDEFDGTKINWDVWTPQVRKINAYNNGYMYYTDSLENTSVSNGMCTIIGRWHETEENSLTTARIETKDHMMYKYGYVEIRARLPKGNGTWPAFWALGKGAAYQEIDFFELFTNTDSQIMSTEHRWYSALDTSGEKIQSQKASSDSNRYYDLPDGQIFNDEFHTFGCEWTPEAFRFMVDGYCYYTLDISGEEHDLNHTPVYLILCLQIGVAGMAKGVDETTPMPSKFEIDYVRLYQRPGISELNILN